MLTVGAGNSGCDLAVDVANARLESTISIRRGQMFQPKAVFGRPRAEIGWLAKLPVRLNERIARAMSRRRDRPGARVPRAARSRRRATSTSSRPWSTTCCPTGSSTAGSTSRRAIERLDGRRVHFADGTSREFDTILWATGFKVALPFLDPPLSAGATACRCAPPG